MKAAILPSIQRTKLISLSRIYPENPIEKEKEDQEEKNREGNNKIVSHDFPRI